jgi:hypothetical protein
MAGPRNTEAMFQTLSRAIFGTNGLTGSRTEGSWRPALSSGSDAPSTPRSTSPEATAVRGDIPLRTGPLTTAPRLLLISSKISPVRAPATSTGYVVRAGRDVAVGARRALRGDQVFRGVQQGKRLTGSLRSLHAAHLSSGTTTGQEVGHV